jgi:hypothetical protein
MCRVGFESETPVLERPKIFHALDRATNVTGDSHGYQTENCTLVIILKKHGKNYSVKTYVTSGRDHNVMQKFRHMKHSQDFYVNVLKIRPYII